MKFILPIIIIIILINEKEKKIPRIPVLDLLNRLFHCKKEKKIINLTNRKNFKLTLNKPGKFDFMGFYFSPSLVVNAIQ